jgi:hypothetical protein
MTQYGFLAIWTEIDEEYFIDYRHWLTREHIAQRIFAPGFLGARVHVRPDNNRSHFILYATQGRSVLQSGQYLNVLNHPTPWTQKMMPRLRKFDRGAGEQVAKVGDGTAAWLAVSRLPTVADDRSAERIGEILREAMTVEGVVTARVFAVDQESTAIQTTEKQMRLGKEGAFNSLLVVEAFTDRAVISVKEHIGPLVGSLSGRATPRDFVRYRFVYALHPFESATETPAAGSVAGNRPQRK